jgi:hypothetical protein
MRGLILPVVNKHLKVFIHHFECTIELAVDEILVVSFLIVESRELRMNTMRVRQIVACIAFPLLQVLQQFRAKFSISVNDVHTCCKS